MYRPRRHTFFAAQSERYDARDIDFMRARHDAAEDDLIQIPWRDISAVMAGLDSNPKEKAFLRLLLSPVVAPTQVHFVSQVFDAVFTPEFRGRVYLRKPSG